MVIESQVQAEGLHMNQAMDLVLHPLRLYCSHPRQGAGKELPEDPKGCDSQCWRRNGIPTRRGYEPVYQRSQEQGLTGWDQSLAHQQDAPTHSPPSRRPPNQGQGTTPRGQLAKEMVDLAERHKV